MDISKRKPALPRNQREGTPTKRSCKQCNQRKVGCDKKEPCCSRCLKSGVDCTYPGQKRAPRKLKRPPVPEILSRLKELEKEVKLLRSGVKNLPENSEETMALAQTSVVDEAVIPRGRLFVRDGRSRYVGDEASVVLGEKVSLLKFRKDAKIS